jgi:hypothetical protein
VTKKNGNFWNVTRCGSYKNGRFGVTYRLHHQSARIGELGTLAVTSNRRTIVTGNVVPRSPILVTPVMEAIRYSETLVLTRGITA